MKTHNFKISILDTDSLTISKQNNEEFTQEEIDELTKEINQISPEMIKWEFEFYIPKILVLKSKNYVLVDFKGHKTVKGSALKDQKRAPILLQFMQDIVDILLEEGKEPEINQLYFKYIKMTKDIKDIAPWCKKVTITDKIFKCKGHETLSKQELKDLKLRANETKVYDALKGRHVQEGDKIYTFFLESRAVSLLEDFNGDYSRLDLIKGLYNCLKVFKNVIDMDLFLNYSLKSYKEELGAVDET
jgi:DNA polymerase elongation subunit (family B)